ncbi:MAG: hypothetical protein M3Z08_07480 [Chloroflexota bacterium]|nr:hypothetical protein [Chloroflexota bacterium]
MHTKDPMKGYYRFFFICEGIVLIGFLVQDIISIAVGRPNYFFIGYTVFFLLLLIFAFFSFRRRHQRTELRRQKALAGDPALLAQPQPQADAHALQLPVKISLHLSKVYLLEALGILYVFMALVTGGTFLILAVPSSAGHPSRGIGISLPLFCLIILSILLVMFLLAFLTTVLISGPFVAQEITLDEEGVTTKFYRHITHLSWNEIQTFALWGNAKRFATLQFELTGEHDIACWFKLGPRRKFLARLIMLKPDMPFDEYQDAMNKIQQVIVARSGKPLYDLRDEKIVMW